MNQEQIKKDKLKRAYSEVMNTASGREVFKDIFSNLGILAVVYRPNSPTETSLADLAFRDGQRNAGIFIYQRTLDANPDIACEIHKSVYKGVLKSENNFYAGDEE